MFVPAAQSLRAQRSLTRVRRAQEADAMHDSVNASYEARIRGLQALLCAGAPEAPAAHCALEAHVQRGALASIHSCGWHSTGSVASVASGTIAEQQAIAAAMQVPPGAQTFGPRRKL